MFYIFYSALSYQKLTLVLEIAISILYKEYCSLFRVISLVQPLMIFLVIPKVLIRTRVQQISKGQNPNTQISINFEMIGVSCQAYLIRFSEDCVLLVEIFVSQEKTHFCTVGGWTRSHEAVNSNRWGSLPFPSFLCECDFELVCHVFRNVFLIMNRFDFLVHFVFIAVTQNILYNHQRNLSPLISRMRPGCFLNHIAEPMIRFKLTFPQALFSKPLSSTKISVSPGLKIKRESL